MAFTSTAGYTFLAGEDSTPFKLNKLALPSIVDGQSYLFSNTGLSIKDVGGSFALNLKPGSTLTANRILTLTTGDAARNITLSGDPTLADWFNQSVKTSAAPLFSAVTLSGIGSSGDSWRATNGTITSILTYDTGVGAVGTSSAHPLVFWTSSLERARIDTSGNFVFGTGAISTSATNGFIYVPSGAGAPSGVPTSYTGRIAQYYDTTNNKIWFYNGSWRGVLVT